MKYESKLEQDRRVIRSMNGHYRLNRSIEHDQQAMADLILANKGVEHVTCWTVGGRHMHSTVKT